MKDPRHVAFTQYPGTRFIRSQKLVLSAAKPGSRRSPRLRPPRRWLLPPSAWSCGMGAAGNRGTPAPKASSFKEVTKLAYSLAVEDSSSIARRGWELSGIGVLTPAQLLWNRKNSTQIDLRYPMQIDPKGIVGNSASSKTERSQDGCLLPSVRIGFPWIRMHRGLGPETWRAAEVRARLSQRWFHRIVRSRS